MNQDNKKSINDFIEDKPARKPNWSAFVETDVVNFFNLHELEKLTVEDGNGSKAKLTRQKDGNIKVECSSTSIL